MSYTSAQDPPRPPFSLLHSVLRALNDTRVRVNALLTRLDVPLHLVPDAVP